MHCALVLWRAQVTPLRGCVLDRHDATSFRGRGRVDSRSAQGIAGVGLWNSTASYEE